MSVCFVEPIGRLSGMIACLKIGVENELFSIKYNIVTIIFALILLLLFMLSYV